MAFIIYFLKSVRNEDSIFFVRSCAYLTFLPPTLFNGFIFIVEHNRRYHSPPFISPDIVLEFLGGGRMFYLLVIKLLKAWNIYMKNCLTSFWKEEVKIVKKLKYTMWKGFEGYNLKTNRITKTSYASERRYQYTFEKKKSQYPFRRLMAFMVNKVKPRNLKISDFPLRLSSPRLIFPFPHRFPSLRSVHCRYGGLISFFFMKI